MDAPAARAPLSSPGAPDSACIEEKILIAAPADAGLSLLAWLVARFPSHGEGELRQLVRVGRVQGLDRPLEPDTPLAAGERIRLWRPALQPTEAPPPLPVVLYEDPRLLALGKPAGMLVHPSGPDFVWALVGLMRQARPGEALHLAHRLDRYTSGVVLLARDAETNRYLKEAFRVRAVEKRYLAVVWGSPTWRDMLVDAPIGPHPASAIRLKMGVRPDGLPARTLFHVRARFSGMTLVECEPTTGRTHQIRVHLHSLGHPILGDRLYGQPEALFLHLYEHGEDERCLRALGLPRQALHAWRLALPHPDGGRLEIRAPLPEDLRELLRAGQAPQIVPYPDEEPPP